MSLEGGEGDAALAGLMAVVQQEARHGHAPNRRRRSAFATTLRLEKAIAARGDHRVEQADRGQRHGGDVVAEGPAEVLLDRPQRRAREADGVAGGAQVAADERQVGGLDRHVGAGADRKAEVGLRERRRIVDAVAGHRHHAPFAPAGAG